MYELSEAFDAFDIDGNGEITVDEMRVVNHDGHRVLVTSEHTIKP